MTDRLKSINNLSLFWLKGDKIKILYNLKTSELLYDGLKYLDLMIKDSKSLNFEVLLEILKKSLDLVSNSKYENHISLGLQILIKILKNTLNKEEKSLKMKKIEAFCEILLVNRRIFKIKNDKKAKYSFNLKDLVSNLYKLLSK